jgi:uncharacterized protein with FMN-binding domain
MHRAIPALLLTATAAVPAGITWSATHTALTPHPTATPTHKTTTKKTRHKTTKTATRTFTGPSEDMQWGPVQVTITIKGKKIVDARASAPTERARSAFINEQAIPWLRQETLQAQSANIDLISGATMTSEAYDASLQAALDAAHKAHAI